VRNVANPIVFIHSFRHVNKYIQNKQFQPIPDMLPITIIIFPTRKIVIKAFGCACTNVGRGGISLYKNLFFFSVLSIRAYKDDYKFDKPFYKKYVDSNILTHKKKEFTDLSERDMLIDI
jgi:hypothetical protein